MIRANTYTGYMFPILISLIESIPENLRGRHPQNYHVVYTTVCQYLKVETVVRRYFSDYREAKDFLKKVQRESRY